MNKCKSQVNSSETLFGAQQIFSDIGLTNIDICIVLAVTRGNYENEYNTAAT